MISYAHMDHYGSLRDLDASLPVFVGPETMDWIGGGEDAAPKGEKELMTFSTSFLKDCTFIETDCIRSSKIDERIKTRIKDIKAGPFDKARDFFGDGSVSVASAEGLNMLW